MRPRPVSTDTTASGTTAAASVSPTAPTRDSWLLLLASGEEHTHPHQVCLGGRARHWPCTVRGSTPTGRERHDHCQGCWFYSLSISTGRHTHADTHMQKQTQTHTHASSHIGHENLPSKPREATVNATCTCTQTCTQAHSRTHTHTSAHISSSQLRVTHAHMFAVR